MELQIVLLRVYFITTNPVESLPLSLLWGAKKLAAIFCWHSY